MRKKKRRNDFPTQNEYNQHNTAIYKKATTKNKILQRRLFFAIKQPTTTPSTAAQHINGNQTSEWFLFDAIVNYLFFTFQDEENQFPVYAKTSLICKSLSPSSFCLFVDFFCHPSIHLSHNLTRPEFRFMPFVCGNARIFPAFLVLPFVVVVSAAAAAGRKTSYDTTAGPYLDDLLIRANVYFTICVISHVFLLARDKTSSSICHEHLFHRFI